MTLAETLKLLTAISLLFPKFELRKNKEELRMQADLWRQKVGDLDFKNEIAQIAGRAKKLQLKKTRKGDHNAVAIAITGE